MPKFVSGILAKVLLPTFAEMREWEQAQPKGKKLQRLTRPRRRSQTEDAMTDRVPK